MESSKKEFFDVFENNVKSKKIIRIFCDESCHLKKDDTNILSLGAISVDEEEMKSIKSEFKRLKSKYNLNENQEIKWTKISKSRFGLYKELISLFSNSNMYYVNLSFFNIDKRKNYTKKEFDKLYYDAYEVLFEYITFSNYKYRIYFDKKDTNGKDKLKYLKNAYNSRNNTIKESQILEISEITSDRNIFIQICDLFTGAIAYALRLSYGDMNSPTTIPNGTKIKISREILSLVKKEMQKFKIHIINDSEIQYD